MLTERVLLLKCSALGFVIHAQSSAILPHRFVIRTHGFVNLVHGFVNHAYTFVNHIHWFVNDFFLQPTSNGAFSELPDQSI